MDSIAGVFTAGYGDKNQPVARHPSAGASAPTPMAVGGPQPNPDAAYPEMLAATSPPATSASDAHLSTSCLAPTAPSPVVATALAANSAPQPGLPVPFTATSSPAGAAPTPNGKQPARSTPPSALHAQRSLTAVVTGPAHDVRGAATPPWVLANPVHATLVCASTSRSMALAAPSSVGDDDARPLAFPAVSTAPACPPSAAAAARATAAPAIAALNSTREPAIPAHPPESL